MKAKELLEKFGKISEESNAKESIVALIDTDFSKNDEEKGKAAQLIKGLFFSKDELAVQFIKDLDKALSNMDASKYKGE